MNQIEKLRAKEAKRQKQKLFDNPHHTVKEVVHSHNGIKFLCREGASDEKTFSEVIGSESYERPFFKIESGETWLDLGGNVGAFTVLAATKGARLITFEPDPVNVEMIKKNLALNHLQMAAEIRQACVMPNDQKTVVLNLWPEGQSWRNSAVRNKKGTKPLVVPCENFYEVAKPEHCVKMDIEGSEIGILEKWPLGWRTKKLVFEYSFDVDPSVIRLRAILDRLKSGFPNVRYASQIDRIDEWKFFPPATIIHCW